MNKSVVNQWLKANISQNRATHFILKPDGTNMVYTYNREKLLSSEPDDDLVDKISPNPQSRYIYRWNNGRVGAIFPEADGQILDFREYELYDGPDDTLRFPKGLRPVKEGDEDCDECKEMLAVGIVAYYLNMRNKKNPKDIFADYLKNEINIFNISRNSEMPAWNPEYKKHLLYSDYIIQEKINIRVSSQIFDFLSKTDVAEIKNMSDNYIAFVGSRTTRGDHTLTWKEEKQCFKDAVLSVMGRIKRTGGYLFVKNSHWKAVYRFAVDSGIMYDKDDPNRPKDPNTTHYTTFKNFSEELRLDVNIPDYVPSFKITNIDDLSKEKFARYNKDHSLWSNEGLKDERSLTLYKELDVIYVLLRKKYEELIDRATAIIV